MLYVLAEPSCLFGNAVAAQPIDLVPDCQVFCLLILVSFETQNEINKSTPNSIDISPEAQYCTRVYPVLINVLTHFTEAFIFIDPAVDLDRGVSGVLQDRVSGVSGVCVFLDGLEQQGVASDSLNRHHQEETQRGCVHLGPEDRNDQR